MASSQHNSKVLDAAGVVVTRVMVPIWLLTGIVLALSNGNASHLPASLVKWVGPLGVDLVYVLYFGAAVELTVVGVAWFLPRLARFAELVLLTVFLPILIGDIALGAASCGCFGAVQVSPWFTLSADILLLLGVWFLGKQSPSLRLERELGTWRVVLAGLWALASFALSFGVMVHAQAPAASATGADGADGTQVALPSYFLPEYETWIGQPWHETPIAQFVKGMPDDASLGVRYVLFYRLDCEHCHELMEAFFSAVMPAPTIAVAVPEKNGFPVDGVLPLPCTECSRAELPVGCDWFIGTPALVRLRDGIVECAAEVTASNPHCIEW